MKAPANRNRSFGLSVGGVLLLIAAALVWRGRIGRAEILGAIGAVLVLAGWLWPAVLGPLSRAWFALAGVLGWINSRILLTVLFFLVLTPLGFIQRLRRSDPLRRDRSASGAGWVPYPERFRDGKHFDRMF